MKCKWCGADLWYYLHIGPLHGKDGGNLNVCDLIQFRGLRDDLIERATNSGSFSFDDIERAKQLAAHDTLDRRQEAKK